MPSISRRTLLQRTALGAAGVGLAGCRGPGVGDRAGSAGGAEARPPSRPMRLIHATDMHVQAQRRGGEGWAAMLRHMMRLEVPADLLITGGDLVMDATGRPHAEVAAQWDLFNQGLADNVPADLPRAHVIGNHDFFGRLQDRAQVTGQEPEFLRGWFLQNFGYSRTYQAIRQGGWKFLLLDSFTLLPRSRYLNRLEPTQWDWLVGELQNTDPGTPVAVVTHAPILSATALCERQAQVSDEGLTVKPTRVHVDHRQMLELFARHPNVRLCLHGHLHQYGRTEFDGITHICSGAVSGEKWQGWRGQTPEGYGIVDLHPDGRFDYRYQTYGWQAES